MASGGDEPVWWVGQRGPGEGGTLESERGRGGWLWGSRGVLRGGRASRQGGAGQGACPRLFFVLGRKTTGGGLRWWVGPEQ